MNEDLKASGQIIQDLEDKCNYQEDYNHHNNLQIFSIEERSDGETWEQTAVWVSKLLEDKLELPNVELEGVAWTSIATHYCSFFKILKQLGGMSSNCEELEFSSTYVLPR